MNSCRIQPQMSKKKPTQQPQPPKLPKQSPSSNTSQAKNLGQLVPVSPVSLANRYVVSIIPKPNYERPLLTQTSFSSTLVSPTPRVITPYIVDDLALYSPKDHPSPPAEKISLLRLKNLTSSTSFILNLT